MNNVKNQTINYYILMIFVCLSPIIDVLNSILQRNGFLFSIGILYKGLMLIYLGYFFIFKIEKNKYKNMFIIYLILLLVWGLLFFGSRYSLLTIRDIFYELVTVFKNFYIIILTILLYFFFQANNIETNKIKKIFCINFLVYLLLLLIPFVTNTGFESYKESMNGGVVGWFYAANEIGAIILLLFFYNYKELNSKSLYYFVIILTFILLGLQIGTKVVLMGFIIILSYYLISYFILKRNKNIAYTFMTLIFTIIMAFNGVIKDNINNLLNQNNPIFDNTSSTETNNENEDSTIPENGTILLENDDYFQKFMNLILSGRFEVLKKTNRIYMNSNVTYKILGIGYTNTKIINNKDIEKLIEIDIFDIFFHCGLIGFLLFIAPFIYFASYLIKNFKKVINNFDILSDVFLIVLILLISLTAGHVLSAPSVSLLLSLYFIELLGMLTVKKERNSHEKN